MTRYRQDSSAAAVDDPTPANPLSHNYAPLQQLFVDPANNTAANCKWITPDQYNDLHAGLKGGFMGLTEDAVNIRQGDKRPIRASD